MLDLFEDRLRDYGAGVYRTSDVQACVREAMHNRGKNSLIIPAGIPRHWLPAGLQFLEEAGLSYRELDASAGVLSACEVGIAETGSIVLRHSKETGRRAATLIPDYHLCVVEEHQIVATVPEGISRCASFTRDPLTTVSGPSATSDIEMTRVKGVHGPRTLDVIIVLR